jgi:hypothetical protein
MSRWNLFNEKRAGETRKHVNFDKTGQNLVKTVKFASEMTIFGRSVAERYWQIGADESHEQMKFER